MVDVKLQEIKEASRKRRESGAVGGSNHNVLVDVLPSWDDFLEEEDSHYGNLVNWSFQK